MTKPQILLTKDETQIQNDETPAKKKSGWLEFYDNSESLLLSRKNHYEKFEKICF
ncbi:hypothetical protein C2G38_2122537 [Gigaspora rosea]|uniref:Uncharacterized protein n=1 Tax=Gigaspora rosea TaxID=44941 RepID=A0A397U3S8_9GLOM|nr:hypothetical protein C2G38_2122537 [Gigaspora rosea]